MVEAETIYFTGCCMELLPIIYLVDDVESTEKLSQFEKPKICNHEDSAGTLILTNTLPPQCTLCSKQYTIETNCICLEFIVQEDVDRIFRGARRYFH